VGWLASGPLFRFSDTWQLIINTSTTIVTFLMVFVIQNAQNRDARAIHIKLDELIRATTGAENSVLDLARLSDRQLLALEHHYERIGDMEDHEVNEELEDIQAEKKQRKRS
jgi:low affinity Fe/Cu permease